MGNVTTWTVLWTLGIHPQWQKNTQMHYRAPRVMLLHWNNLPPPLSWMLPVRLLAVAQCVVTGSGSCYGLLAFIRCRVKPHDCHQWSVIVLRLSRLVPCAGAVTTIHRQWMPTPCLWMKECPSLIHPITQCCLSMKVRSSNDYSSALKPYFMLRKSVHLTNLFFLSHSYKDDGYKSSGYSFWVVFLCVSTFL